VSRANHSWIDAKIVPKVLTPLKNNSLFYI
jgi:hypothetical protein